MTLPLDRAATQRQRGAASARVSRRVVRLPRASRWSGSRASGRSGASTRCWCSTAWARSSWGRASCPRAGG